MRKPIAPGEPSGRYHVGDLYAEPSVVAGRAWALRRQGLEMARKGRTDAMWAMYRASDHLRRVARIVS